MTDTLTMDQIRAAADKDIDATAAVSAATESRVVNLARKAALGDPGTDRHAEYVEEFSQVGRIVVWESVSRFKGDNVHSFFAFICTTVEAALKDAAREAAFPGAPTDALKTLMSMMGRAYGDAHLAAKLAQTVPPAGKRLSADLAEAARVSYMASASLSVPSPYGEWSDMFTSDYGVPDDLVTAEDRSREDRRIKHAVVGSILDTMGEGQAKAVKHSFGIHGYQDFGHGQGNCDLQGLADALGVSMNAAKVAKSKGMQSFAKRYIKAMAASPERAEELAEAAASNLRGAK